MAFGQPGPEPDSLAVDDRCDIWAAVYGGRAAHRYWRDGKFLRTVELPVAQVTSCAFGDTDRDTLFVTTAREELDAQALARQLDAGRVFRIAGLGVEGRGCNLYRGSLP